MRPYYEHAGITIYHGDCREILPDMSADAIVTDPPYGLDFRGANWDGKIPDWWLEMAIAAAPVVCFTTGQTTQWDYPRPDWILCWHRPASNARATSGGFSHWSPVLVYGKAKWPVDHISLHAIQHAAPAWVDHPSPKPVELGKWLIGGASPSGGVVLDCFAGSGSFLVAAKELGRKAIGIEAEERYCELAARRLSQEVLNFGAVAP